MLTIQEKINYLTELIEICQFAIEASQSAIIDYPNDDKPGFPSRNEFLSRQIALKTLYEEQLTYLNQ